MSSTSAGSGGGGSGDVASSSDCGSSFTSVSSRRPRVARFLTSLAAAAGGGVDERLCACAISQRRTPHFLSDDNEAINHKEPSYDAVNPTIMLRATDHKTSLTSSTKSVVSKSLSHTTPQLCLIYKFMNYISEHLSTQKRDLTCELVDLRAQRPKVKCDPIGCAPTAVCYCLPIGTYGIFGGRLSGLFGGRRLFGSDRRRRAVNGLFAFGDSGQATDLHDEKSALKTESPNRRSVIPNW